MQQKWALLDRGKTAHWWLGDAGTICGRDFTHDLRIADDDEAPICNECFDGLPAHLANRRA